MKDDATRKRGRTLKSARKDKRRRVLGGWSRRDGIDDIVAEKKRTGKNRVAHFFPCFLLPVGELRRTWQSGDKS